MRYLIAMALILGAQTALAGFIKIKGSSSRTYEYGNLNTDVIHELQGEADSDAIKKCPDWMPIQRTSQYRVYRDPIPYFGVNISVQADYICGESDY